MFKYTHHPFESVAIRDLWLWNHWEDLGKEILAEGDADRLYELPNYDENTHPGGVTWIGYAKNVALALEEQQRWSESQAYWLAAARFAVQDYHTTSQDLFDIFAAVIRTGERSAAMSLSNIGSEIEDLVQAGLDNPHIHVKEAVVKSLTYVGSLYGSIYEDLSLSRQARVTFVETLQGVGPDQLKKDFLDKKIKGSHQQFIAAVNMYTKQWRDLFMSVDELSTKLLLRNVINQQSKMLVLTDSRFSSFLLQHDQQIVTRVRSLLVSLSEFKAYDEPGVELDDELVEAFNKNALGVINAIGMVGSELGSCILVPLVRTVGVAINQHYQGIIHSKLPDLSVILTKPASRTSNTSISLDIGIQNRGAGSAEGCRLYLHVPIGTDNVIPDSFIDFDVINPNQIEVRSSIMTCPDQLMEFELPYVFEWHDRSGNHNQRDILKVTRQRQINWTEVTNLPKPYNIRSVSQPNRLKGRGELLEELRLGLQGEDSFMITGQKRVGKTSLVKVFFAELNKRQDILPIYMSIGKLSIAHGDIGNLGNDLAEEVSRTYKKKFMEDLRITIPTTEEFRVSFNKLFTRFIEDVTEEHSLTLAFALDDFDYLPTNLFTGPIGKAFFLALRALIDQGTSFCFIGSERLPAILGEQGEQAELLNQVKQLVVDYLDKEPLRELVCEPTKEVLDFKEEALQAIEIWSARNPYFANMICDALWRRALKKKDFWIAPHDVTIAVEEIAEKSDRRSYQHFWSDSPSVKDSERDLYETKSSRVILSLSKHQPDPMGFARRQTIIQNCEGLRFDEAEKHLQKLIQRKIVETSLEDDELVRIRVPMFTLWLKRQGRDETRKAQEKGVREVTSAEVVAVADGLSYRGKEISSDDIRRWLEQFGDVENQRLMLKLLKQIRDTGIYTPAKFAFALKDLHELVKREANAHGFQILLDEKNKKRIKNFYVTHADMTGKSGSASVVEYRRVNSITEQRSGAPDKIIPQLATSPYKKIVLVCVDDFIGSGLSASGDIKQNVIAELENRIPNWRERILLIYASVVGFEKGIELIEERIPEIVVACFSRLTDADKAFSELNDIFTKENERLQAREIAHSVGLELEPDNPLGWEASQALVVFPSTVPNNTLPILYKEGVFDHKVWKALFPRQ
jgi:AAA+ ATPase superfamily predicted ATPase